MHWNIGVHSCIPIAPHTIHSPFVIGKLLSQAALLHSHQSSGTLFEPTGCAPLRWFRPRLEPSVPHDTAVLRVSLPVQTVCGGGGGGRALCAVWCQCRPRRHTACVSHSAARSRSIELSQATQRLAPIASSYVRSRGCILTRLLIYS